MRHARRVNDPLIIRIYSTTFLPVTRRLLSSQAELAREAQDSPSPLRRFISLANVISGQPKSTNWTTERLQSLLNKAQQSQVCRNDLTEEFLDRRDHPNVEEQDMKNWIVYEEKRKDRRYWSEALCCSYAWNWDLSRSLKLLFSRRKLGGPPIKSCEVQDKGWIMTTSESRVPDKFTIEYKSETGEIKCKTFRADPSLERIPAGNDATDGGFPLSKPRRPVVCSSPMGCKLEYKSILEYREINRHARRKIESWLNDGWCLSWEWNGLHDYVRGDSRYNGKYKSGHWMCLRRTKVDLPPSASNQKIILKFPETPKPPPDSGWHIRTQARSNFDTFIIY